VFKWYVCGKCVMRKLNARRIVLVILHVPWCHACMLELHTRITFSDTQQLLLALAHNYIDHG
jgi:hypothetical protein